MRLLTPIVDRWLRRHWKADPAALARLGETRPLTVVTGASEGIGLAFANALAARGHDLVLIARHEDRLAVAAAGIRATYPHRTVLILPLDLARAESTSELSQFLASESGHADILVNNAAIGLSDDFADHPPDNLDQLVRLNVSAATSLMHHVLPAMLARGRGGIINVASLGGLTPGPYQAAYYASKAYLISLTRAVAWETRGQGVRLVAVTPGPVNTGFHARMRAEGSLYRLVIPALSPERVVNAALLGYDLGWSIVVPGLLNRLGAIAMHILPPGLVIPLIGVLLRPPAEEPDVRGEQ